MFMNKQTIHQTNWLNEPLNTEEERGEKVHFINHEELELET